MKSFPTMVCTVPHPFVDVVAMFMQVVIFVLLEMLKIHGSRILSQNTWFINKNRMFDHFRQMLFSLREFIQKCCL